MASKKTKPAPTDEELGELFEGIGDDTALKKTTKPKSTSSSRPKSDASAEQDILAELENELGEKPPERPHTPRVREVAKRTSINTPSPATEAPRKSAEGAASHRTHPAPPSAASSEQQQETEKKTPALQARASSGGGSGGGGGSSSSSWWGGLLSTASAAMKQAEAAVKEIQQNEEARKWADQVRGNVGALKGLGDELRHRALPTFTNILNTLAPPISSHERLVIHITHDLAGYPSLDPLIYDVFNRVMAQVEGGDLMVIQRGQDSTLRDRSASSSSSGGGFFSAVHQSSAGWRDGPWWRQTDTPRDLGVVQGLAEGTKLCRASAEGYAADYFAAHGGIERARQRASEPPSESNPVRSSDIFLSVQAVGTRPDRALFARSAAAEKDKETSLVAEEDEDADGEVCFAVFLLDPVHEIQYATVSQAVPARWIRWLDAPATPATPASGDDDEFHAEFGLVPEEIREIVESGGVDPREWVAEWVEEALALSVGVVAQKYVARRMGVGEGGIGKGKKKVESVIEAGGNEVARAGLI
ncbi:hypothetical protein VTH06DRAFT_6424 [Thermothelomyces fergusii]